MCGESERANTSHHGGKGESRPFRVAEPYGFVAFRPAIERGGDESLGHQRHPNICSPAGRRFALIAALSSADKPRYSPAVLPRAYNRRGATRAPGRVPG